MQERAELTYFSDFHREEDTKAAVCVKLCFDIIKSVNCVNFVQKK